MKAWPLHRAPSQRRPNAKKDPEQVIRAFWRTVEKVAARSHGSAPVARGATRQKP